MRVSLVIRTLNEARHLGELLDVVRRQTTEFDVETVIVDSGSTDETLKIADQFGCRVVHIAKRDFTFGRSLNLGCAAATGNILVFVSGHCVPCDTDWLARLIEPLRSGHAVYAYGRQFGDDSTRFSEHQVFSKYYPPVSQVPQEGFFCNNANAALLRSAWEQRSFDEQLTGLEDMKLAKDLVAGGEKVAYVAEAGVFHIHDESWRQVRVRYEREALALREIMPELHVGFGDFVRYFVSGVLHDCGVALEKRFLSRYCSEIVLFRLMQFWGTYQGNKDHRQVSARQREEYFYPRPGRTETGGRRHSGAAAAESAQRTHSR